MIEIDISRPIIEIDFLKIDWDRMSEMEEYFPIYKSALKIFKSMRENEARKTRI